jgi:alpha-mannosidase
MISNSYALKKIGKFINGGLILLVFVAFKSSAQKAYFIDGFHGGLYGHYPLGSTQFIDDKLKENPSWKINLEIEPETWDSIFLREPAALKELQQLFADQSTNGRIEYVSPAYGQSYMYNISGESIIRQFSYGIKKVRKYFPGAVFTTYSSEEPCFTSALPQILKSFGYKYTSLKNPNTCWGGYTRAYGGELLNWVGPDGTKLTTVPRYAIEGLLPNSTWQTEAWTNSLEYIQAAFRYGIKNPVAMTLQDAGWKNGPWIGNGDKGYQPTEYKTWRGYIENSSIKTPKEDWHFSQEDVLVSLVWGSQVLQKIAQQVRVSENKIVMAEKLAAIAKVYKNAAWPRSSFDEAWRTLMLSQHHDCWIVPYNGKPGNTWADKVKVWTSETNHISDSIIANALVGKASAKTGNNKTIRVYNTTGNIRSEMVKLLLPANSRGKIISIVDGSNKEVISQIVSSVDGASEIYFKANVPAIGYKTFTIENKKTASVKGATAATLADGNVVLETDIYKVVLDKTKGGSIKNLVAKKLNNKEFVDAKSERSFNELSGNFFNNGGFHSTSESPVTINVIEEGPAVVKAEIKGVLLSHSFTQTLTLKQGDMKIDCNLRIDWKGNVGIGDDYKQHEGLDAKDYKKPFYNDSKKLLALFPVNFSSKKIYKDAPFDVTESKLDNTFFSRWDSIKNNIMISWVDVFDAQNKYGLAILTDHTTTYAQGENFPTGLNIQYSGAGLWGRNHTITGATEINYAIIPHAGKWDEAHISAEAVNWNEPLIASLTSEKEQKIKSLVDVTGTGLQVTAVLIDGKDLLVRLFNAEGDNKNKKIVIGGNAEAANLVELDGTEKETLPIQKGKSGIVLNVEMPRFGIRTIRLKNLKKF